MNFIKPGSTVTLHFSLKLADGSVADSTKVSGKPAVFKMGEGIVSDAMEAQLLGLKAGDCKQFMLAPEDAAGMPQENLIHVLPRSQFPADMGLAIGTIIAFGQPDGTELPGIIRRIEGDHITVDFNHPLAGQALNIEVEIIEVE